MKFLLIFCFAAAGCSKEQMTTYDAKFVNATSHNISVNPYFGSTSPAKKRVVVNAHDSIVFGSGSERGLADRGGFYSECLGGSDSLVVFFDGIYVISHYVSPAPAILAPKYYLTSSTRNIYNPDNYEYSYRDATKNHREAKYRYVFTEQDYNDAR